MNVLLLWPPHVPSYFNAGHHLPLFLTAEYLRANSDVGRVDVVDAGALSMTWKELADILVSGDYSTVALMNDFDAIDGIGRTCEYVRQLAPRATLITFGRLSNRIPGFFGRYGFDAVVASGDYEAGISAWVGRGSQMGSIPGVWRRDGNGRLVPPDRPGRQLEPEEWQLPDVTEIPYASYDRLYARDENKFCGIPQRRELVVPVARGCPIGCAFCEVPGLQGRRDRRLQVGRVVDYIASAFSRSELQLEYVSFYAPTFTLNARWVVELCESLRLRDGRWPWKCTTTLSHLDEALVHTMAEAGCVRISVGVETLDKETSSYLPRSKRLANTYVQDAARWCNNHNIELNCFVILGLPGSSAHTDNSTVEELRALGARVRPTMYMPIEDLHNDMSEQEVARFNRHFSHGERSDDDARLLHAILFTADAPTHAGASVPQRVA